MSHCMTNPPLPRSQVLRCAVSAACMLPQTMCGLTCQPLPGSMPQETSAAADTAAAAPQVPGLHQRHESLTETAGS